MKRPALLFYIGLGLLVWTGVASSPAQTASVLHIFSDGSGGDEPTALIQARDGNFYGITSYGGGQGTCEDDQNTQTGCGTIFRVTSSGTLTVLYSFTGETDGGIPSSLIQGPDGNIYGTTMMGGEPPASPPSVQCNVVPSSDGSPATGPCCPPDTNGNPLGCGTIFEFSPTQGDSVTPNTLYSFTGEADGGSPGTLILGADSSGTAVIFGTTLSCSNCALAVTGSYFAPTGGTIFSFVPRTPPGSTIDLNTIVTFSATTAAFQELGSNANLAFPNSLIQWDQNTIYGTTQMGGSTSTGGNAVCQSLFGCGGAFRLQLSSSTLLDLCNFGDMIDVTPPTAAACSAAVMPQTTNAIVTPRRTGRPLPQVIIRQSGARFPTGGNLWSFTSLPITLVADSQGNIYGTTPPGCMDATYPYPYTPDPNCASDHPADAENGDVSSVQSTVFELTPPPESSNSAATVNFLYTFTGNGDGGGSMAGLTLATNGDFYGLSGDGNSSLYGDTNTTSFSSEVFALPAENNTLPNFVSLGPSYSPNWMIQGSDGNFYGTSSTYISGSQTQFGSIFWVTSSPSLPPPVQLCWQAPCSGSQINATSQIQLGDSATLTWVVPYAFSLTSQQCYAFVGGTNASTAGNWSGLQKGSVAEDDYGGSAVITPTAPGTYTYALTCGGTVSSSVVLQVSAAAQGFTLSASPSTLSVPQGGSGTTTITVTDLGGFSGVPPLTVAGLPTGVAANFAPGSSPGTQLLTLTASTSAQVTSTPITVTITGTSGSLSANVSISLSITGQPGFGPSSGGTGSMSVSPGATTGNTATISIGGTNGFDGIVNLTCQLTTTMTDVNDMPTCALTPTSVTISGTAAQTSTLTVTTTARTTAKDDHGTLFETTGGTTLAVLLLFVFPGRRRKWLGTAALFLLCAYFGVVGCGGGGNSGGGGGGNPGTTAGSYTITVTGTSGSVTATVGTINLTVQ